MIPRKSPAGAPVMGKGRKIPRFVCRQTHKWDFQCNQHMRMLISNLTHLFVFSRWLYWLWWKFDLQVVQFFPMVHGLPGHGCWQKIIIIIAKMPNLSSYQSSFIIILTETGLTRMFLTWPTSTGLSWDTMNQTRLTRQTWHQKRQHMDGLSCRKNIQIRFLSIITQIRFLSFDIIIKILKLCKPTLITISTMYSFKTLVSPACSGINTDWMDEFMQVSYSMPTFPRKKFSHFSLVILVLIVESWCRYVKSLAAESTTLQPIRILEVENHFDLNWSSPSR